MPPVTKSGLLKITVNAAKGLSLPDGGQSSSACLVARLSLHLLLAGTELEMHSRARRRRVVLSDGRGEVASSRRREGRRRDELGDSPGRQPIQTQARSASAASSKLGQYMA